MLFFTETNTDIDVSVFLLCYKYILYVLSRKRSKKNRLITAFFPPKNHYKLDILTALNYDLSKCSIWTDLTKKKKKGGCIPIIVFTKKFVSPRQADALRVPLCGFLIDKCKYVFTICIIIDVCLHYQKWNMVLFTICLPYYLCYIWHHRFPCHNRSSNFRSQGGIVPHWYSFHISVYIPFHMYYLSNLQ